MTYDFASCDYPLNMELLLTDATDPKFAAIGKNYELFEKSSEKILELQGTGKLKAAVEEHGVSEKLLHFDQYDVLLQFGIPYYKKSGEITGRTLIGQISEDEFLIVGLDAKI
jgi:hypothetical protein